MTPPLTEPGAQIVMLLPVPGEVILGDVLALAGRVHQTGPGPSSAHDQWLHVAIVADDVILGAADLRVIGHGFAGSITIDAPTRGKVAEVRISDRRHPEDTLLEQLVVVGPGR